MGWLSKKWKQIKGWFTPSEPKPQGVNVEKSGTNQGVPIIYGYMSKAPCIKVFKVTTDKAGGASNEYLHYICVFCVGEIEAIGKLYFNDIPENQIDNKRYFVQRFNGSESQAYCSELSAEFNQWKATATLKNVAYAYVRLKQNSEVDWWNGEPRISANIQGLKVFDPRNGQTQYSDNIALCALDYLTNDNYGKGLTANKINSQSFANAADFIETSKTYTRTVYKNWFDPELKVWEKIVTGTVDETIIENLMTCNVSLSPENTLKKNVEILLGGMRAILPETNGKYRLGIEKDDAPVFPFTEHNLIGPIQCQGGSQSDRYNQVIIKYRNQLTGEDDEAVFPDDDALHQTWKTEDSGKLLLGEFDFDTINNKAEALQMGHVIAYRSRQLIGALFTGLPETIVVEAGDVVTLDSQILGWNAKPFRGESVDIDLESGRVSFQGVEHQNSIYPWAIGDVTEEYADTSFALPQSIQTPTGLTLLSTPSDSEYKGVLSWDDPNNTAVTSHNITIYSVGDNAVVHAENSAFNAVFIPLLTVGDYRVEVVAKNSLFLSDAATLLFTAQIPNAPISLGLVASTFEVGAAPTVGIDNHYVNFELMFGTVNNRLNAQKVGRGRTFTIIDRTPETTYYFWAKTVTPFGDSPWVAGNITTGDGTAIVELIETLSNEAVVELEQDVVLLNSDMKKILESLIWNTTQHQEKTTETAFISADVKQTATALATEAQARATQGTAIEAIINTEKGRTSALISRVDQATSDINGNAQAISFVDGKASSASSTASSAYSLAQQAKSSADGSASSITVISNKVNDSSTGLTATNSLAQSAKITAEGNVSAVTQLQASIDDIVGSGTATTAELQLAVVGNKNQIESVQAQAFLFADVNGRISGVKATSTAAQSNLDFIGGNVRFLKQDGSVAIYFNTVTGEYEFNGDGNFNGTVRADKIIGEQASGAAVSLSYIELSQSYKTLVGFTVSSSGFDRVINIPSPFFISNNSSDPDSKIAVQFLANGSNIYLDSAVSGTTESGYFTAPPRFYNLLANRSVTITIHAKLIGGSGSTAMFSQNYAPTVFKASDEITFN